MKTLFQTERLVVACAAETEIPKIIQLEEHPDNRNYLWIGTVEEHKDEIKDPNHILCVFKEKTVGIIGYALIRLNRSSNVLELRRIAIDKKGIGYGTEIMEKLFEYAFTKLNVNRFWLDVYPDNNIGIKLYEKLGMHSDGVLRENYLSHRGYLDQIIYSMLKSEYDAKMNTK